MNRKYQLPGKRFFHVSDGIMLAFLVLELSSIIPGIFSIISWHQTFQTGIIWHFMSNGIMAMLVMLPFPFLSPIALLTLAAYSLYHKIGLCRGRIYLYKRSNLLCLQVLFLICTVISVIAALDYIGVR